MAVGPQLLSPRLEPGSHSGGGDGGSRGRGERPTPAGVEVLGPLPGVTQLPDVPGT